MRTFLKQMMVVATVSLPLAVSAVALAQPGPRGGDGWGPGSMMGPGMMGGGELGFMCNPRAAGLAEWRMQRIESVIQPNDAQKSALAELRAASTKAAEAITATCATAVPATPNERLALMEKRLEAMLSAIKTVRPAFDKLYSQLSDDQRKRLDAAGPRRWGWDAWRWRWNDRK